MRHFVLLLAMLFSTAALADGEEKPRHCGGLAGLQCATGEFCEFPVGTCGAADQTGSCEKIPEICTKEFVPVCGCNGMTFSNDCMRRAAGVAKKADGAC